MFVRTTSWVAGLVVVLLACAGPAGAVATPVIGGTAQVGETLVASAPWEGEPPAAVAWQWQRCDVDAKKVTCQPIRGATGDRHQLTDADLGHRLRVKLTAGGKSELSALTDVVQAAPPPAPAPVPSPTPDPSPSPTTTSTPPTPSSSTTVPLSVPSEAPPRMLDPFPIVRIRGSLTDDGARVTLLTVRGPRDAQISVRCRGLSCPRRRLAVATAVTRLRPFERELRAGTRLDIKVVRPGWIGKWTVLTIRRGAPPRRSDRCVYPGGRRPVRCPAS